MNAEKRRKLLSVWNWLPAAYFVAELGSIREAARVLGVSPSAVSRMVKLFEEAIDTALFVRSSNRLALTTAGEGFVDQTSEGLERLSRAVVTQHPITRS